MLNIYDDPVYNSKTDYKKYLNAFSDKLKTTMFLYFICNARTI